MTIREQAAILCDVRASAILSTERTIYESGPDQACRHLGFPMAASDLAYSAVEVALQSGRLTWAEQWAEAAAMLRDGEV